MRLETHTRVVTYERISVKGEVVQGRNSDSSNTKDAFSLLHVHILTKINSYHKNWPV